MFHLASLIAALAPLAGQRGAQLGVVAALISFLSSYTALMLIGGAGKPGQKSSDPWLTAAAAALGCGVWAAHFVALLVYEPDLRAAYDAGPALIAVAMGIICSGLGFAIAIRNRPLVGGATVGMAAAATNCAVMAALHPDYQQWSGYYVAISFLSGAVAGAMSLYVAWHSPRSRGQLSGAVILTAGVLLAHFLGIAAIGLGQEHAAEVSPQAIPAIWFSIAVTAISILVVGLGVIGSLASQHITALEATRAQLERTTEHLGLAAKAAATADEAKSQFLASMSHELRTPLNAILGFSELIKDDREKRLDPDKVRSYASSIFESGTHLLALINDILDLSKFDAGRLELNEEPVDIGQAIESCLRLMEPHARKAKVELDASLPEQIPALWADDRRLRQILFNLLSNAVKFTDQGGKVHVAVTWDKDGVAVAVSDTGIGMTQVQIPIALERFGQIDGSHARRYAGTGLGLPLTKHLVELHGGSLVIASERGVGTTVTVLLPPRRILRKREAA